MVVLKAGLGQYGGRHGRIGQESSQDLYGFAIELRKLAYTMPGGHEDPLIRLSQRMGRHAQQQADEKSPPRRLAN